MIIIMIIMVFIKIALFLNWFYSGIDKIKFMDNSLDIYGKWCVGADASYYFYGK